MKLTVDKQNNMMMLTFIVNGQEVKVSPQSTIGETAQIALKQIGDNRDLSEFTAHINQQQVDFDTRFDDVVILTTERVHIIRRPGWGG